MAVGILTIFMVVHATMGWRMIPPKYSLVKQMGSFEVRKYEAVKVARAQENDVDFYEGKVNTFTNLYKYMGGGNEEKKLLSVNLPLIDHIVFGESCHTTQYYSRSYLIPREYQEQPPVPSSSEVKIEKLDERTMLVRSFGGWATRSEIIKEMGILQKDLNDKSITFDSKDVFVTELSAPWIVVNRTNEIALKLTDSLPQNSAVMQSNESTKLTIATENQESLSTEELEEEQERNVQKINGEFVMEILGNRADIMRPIK